MVPTVGKDMKLYRNTGTYATPVWSLIDEIGDLNVSDMKRGLAELKRRANGFVKNLPALVQSISVEFRLIFGLGAANHAILRAAFFSGTCIEYLIFSTGTADALGGEGLRLPGILADFPWNQPLEEVSDHMCRLATGYMISETAEVNPIWFIVAPS